MPNIFFDFTDAKMCAGNMRGAGITEWCMARGCALAELTGPAGRCVEWKRPHLLLLLLFRSVGMILHVCLPASFPCLCIVPCSMYRQRDTEGPPALCLRSGLSKSPEGVCPVSIWGRPCAGPKGGRA